MKNMEKCMMFMTSDRPRKEYGGVVPGIKCEEDFWFKMDLIPEEDKKAIVLKWGLDDSKRCVSFRELDKKMGVENSKEIYTRALHDLSCARALVHYEDTEKSLELICIFSEYDPKDFAKAVALASLRAAIFGDRNQDPLDCSVKDLEERFNQVLSFLQPREAEVLKYRFGLTTGRGMTLMEVGEKIGATRERVRMEEAKALRKLRHPLYTRALLGKHAVSEELSKKKTEKKERPLTEIDGFSVRTYNCLMRAGYDTVEKFMNLSEEDLRKIRNFTERCVEQSLEIQAEIRENKKIE